MRLGSRQLTLVTTVLLAFLVVAGYVYTQQRSADSSFQNVTIQALAEAAEPDHVILDVREDWEYAEGHVPGAVLIPLGQLASRVDELPNDVAIYVICRSGNRSLQASTILQEAGKQDIRNVQGGTLAWQAAGLPIEQP